VIPRATYRLQLHGGFGFRDARELVPYLAELGVSHVYCSPYLKARPGSLHGYDIVDHNALNPEIGSRDEFDAFVAALKAHGMGQIVDVVPNHMAVMGADNAWWFDVLESGPASRYADFFDIDWDPVNPALKGKVLFPVLGDHYGVSLERGELRLALDPAAGTFNFWYHEHRFPADPCEYPSILDSVATASNRDSIPETVREEFASLLTAFRNLPARDDTSPERRAERNRDKEVHKRRLAQLAADSPPLVEAIEAAVHALNGVPGESKTFDALHALLEAQAYRLAYWRVASDEINYRRFFDVNELAALRTENEAVFDATHGFVLELIAAGTIDGLRIDHPDGLFDPAEYFRRLQEGIANARGVRFTEGAAPPFYVVIEKIAAAYERVPESWCIHGTTGYRFMNVVNGLFVDGAAKAKLDRLYRGLTNETADFEDIAYRSKQLIMRTALASELTVLANRLAHIAQGDRRTRDFTLNTLRRALTEVIACLPVYRTYIADTPSAEDRRYIEWAVGAAKRRSRAADPTIFDFVASALLGEAPRADQEQATAVRAFARKFQQLTGPVSAKGVEDTAFYLYNRFVSLNEVGGDPTSFGYGVSTFHGASQDRAAKWPHTMLTTSTHDNKRSEDVRARLDVLSELPAEWRLALRRWSRLTRSRKREVDGIVAPSANDEYLLYQTLVGTWPMEELTESALTAYRDRIQAYMTKAVREAKIDSSWMNVNAEYEAALAGFVDSLLGRLDGNLFLNDFVAFHRRVAWLGMLNGLSQALIKFTSPGVPDLYQGNEVWNLSLVDPDNRRPVDYGRLRELLQEMKQRVAADGMATLMRENALFAVPAEGRAKLFLTWRALHARREQADLFENGDYVPLAAGGARSEHVVAYARRWQDEGLIVIAGRLFARLAPEPGDLPLGEGAWGDTSVDASVIPADAQLQDVFTGRNVAVEGGRLWMRDAFADFPAVLLRYRAAVN
jgi:(1->4)-alpha-D-glucan 1-alpha-D-glucosylmutase